MLHFKHCENNLACLEIEKVVEIKFCKKHVNLVHLHLLIFNANLLSI